MAPLTAGMISLPCRPCLGPRQLKFENFLLVVTIWGVLGMARLHLRHYPIFQYQDFCTLLEWELVWGPFSHWERLLKVSGTSSTRSKLTQLPTSQICLSGFQNFVSVFGHGASKTLVIFSLVNFGLFEKGQSTFLLSLMRCV